MAGVSMKDIKLRIRSMESTKQITKAMEMVASSKLRRAQERMLTSRPYFEALYETLKGTLAYKLDCKDVDHGYTSGVNADLGGAQERIVEQEVQTGNTQENEQQESGRPHNPLRHNAHHGRAEDDDSKN